MAAKEELRSLLSLIQAGCHLLLPTVHHRLRCVHKESNVLPYEPEVNTK
jgi:hypothetical protein